MLEILKLVKLRGECLDSELASITKMPLAEVHLHLSELAAQKLVMLCQSTKFIKGKEVKAIICRISGYIPPAKPGAKPKVQITLS